MFNSNQVSFDKLLHLNFDDDFLGSDSVSLTVSKYVPISITNLIYFSLIFNYLCINEVLKYVIYRICK